MHLCQVHKKTGSAAQADPVFSKISVSAEVFAFQIPHHPHIAGLAALVAPGEQVLIGREIFLADARVARVAVRAGVDAGDDAGGDVVVFPDQCLAVGLGTEIPVAEGAEGRQLFAVVRLAELLADGRRDEAQRNFLRKPPEMDS